MQQPINLADIIKKQKVCSMLDFILFDIYKSHTFKLF